MRLLPYVLHDVLVMSGQPDRAEVSQSTSWKCPAPALLSHQCTLLHHVYFWQGIAQMSVVWCRCWSPCRWLAP